ncbi:hypothetical protein B0H13DRAFT_1899108 [Mycena leptocephala]|nr:hypothetical protein B0H13DRAFT_1899108 [Mycena leptocephala]
MIPPIESTHLGILVNGQLTTPGTAASPSAGKRRKDPSAVWKKTLTWTMSRARAWSPDFYVQNNKATVTMRGRRGPGSGLSEEVKSRKSCKRNRRIPEVFGNTSAVPSSWTAESVDRRTRSQSQPKKNGRLKTGGFKKETDEENGRRRSKANGCRKRQGGKIRQAASFSKLRWLGSRFLNNMHTDHGLFFCPEIPKSPALVICGHIVTILGDHELMLNLHSAPQGQAHVWSPPGVKCVQRGSRRNPGIKAAVKPGYDACSRDLSSGLSSEEEQERGEGGQGQGGRKGKERKEPRCHSAGGVGVAMGRRMSQVSKARDSWTNLDLLVRTQLGLLSKADFDFASAPERFLCLGTWPSEGWHLQCLQDCSRRALVFFSSSLHNVLGVHLRSFSFSNLPQVVLELKKNADSPFHSGVVGTSVAPELKSICKT